jgi:hypothetical protein
MSGALHSQLTTTVTVDGTDQAAAQFAKVQAAQERVAQGATVATSPVATDVAKTGDAAAAAVAPIDALAGAEEKLHVSTIALTTVMTRIHPVLGAMTSTMLNSIRVIGQLASTTISLRSVMDTAAGAIRRNAAALKLIGAGGLVVAAINAIVAAVRSHREQLERLNAELRRNNDLLAEQTVKSREAAQAYTDAANARRKFEGVSADQAAQGADQAAQVAKRFGLERFEGKFRDIGAQTAGLGLTQEELVRLQLGAAGGADVSIDPNLSPEAARRRVERLLGSEDVQRREATTRQQAADQQRRDADVARRELVSTGSTETLARQIAATTGMDMDAARELAEKASQIGATSSKQLADQQQGYRGDILAYLDPTQSRFSGGDGETVTLTKTQVAQLSAALDRLNATMSTNTGPPVVQNNGRYYGSDAAAQRRRSVNGQSRGRGIEARANGF